MGGRRVLRVIKVCWGPSGEQRIEEQKDKYGGKRLPARRKWMLKDCRAKQNMLDRTPSVWTHYTPVSSPGLRPGKFTDGVISSCCFFRFFARLHPQSFVGQVHQIWMFQAVISPQQIHSMTDIHMESLVLIQNIPLSPSLSIMFHLAAASPAPLSSSSYRS